MMEKETLLKKLKSKEIVHIQCSDLAVVWPEAQRPFKEHWAKEIADDLDPDKFDPVQVMLPNGNGIHHICEGQHRVAAIRMKYGPKEQVPCILVEGDNPARAAELFLGVNTGRDAVSRVAEFKVAVTAQRHDEVNINRIIRHCGYRVESSHSVQDTVSAVDALRFAYRKGPKTLDRTLRIIRDTWGGDPNAVIGPIIRGYASLICELSDQIDMGRLREMVCKKYTPGKLSIEAKGVKELIHVSHAEALVQILVRTYNKGLPSSKHLKRKGK
jgi:hypothetical protein